MTIYELLHRRRSAGAVDPNVIYYIQGLNFDGKTAIDTGIPLWQIGNWQIEFDFTFGSTIDTTYERTTFGCMDESGKPYPGFVIRGSRFSTTDPYGWGYPHGQYHFVSSSGVARDMEAIVFNAYATRLPRLRGIIRFIGKKISFDYLVSNFYASKKGSYTEKTGHVELNMGDITYTGPLTIGNAYDGNMQWFANRYQLDGTLNYFKLTKL